MYTLTERRLAAAKPILDRYNANFLQTHQLAPGLEQELRRLWGTGHLEMKQIAVQLLRHNDYRLLAIRFMETWRGAGVPSEFKRHLASAYGMKNNYYSGKDRKELQEAFWKRELPETSPPSA